MGALYFEIQGTCQLTAQMYFSAQALYFPAQAICQKTEGEDPSRTLICKNIVLSKSFTCFWGSYFLSLFFKIKTSLAVLSILRVIS